MRKVKFVLLFVLLALLLSAVVGEALAAGTWHWYDVTVPRVHGSVTTYNESKLFSGHGAVFSHLIGANYKLDVRHELVDNSKASEWYEIDDGTHDDWPVSAGSGQVLHMRLRNKWGTPVNVQADGDWSPDDP